MKYRKAILVLSALCLLQWFMFAEEPQIKSAKELLQGIGLNEPSQDKLIEFITGKSETVTALIKQLNDNDWTKRDNAHKMLVKTGTAAITQLVEAQSNSPIDVKLRIPNIINEINSTENDSCTLAAIRLLGQYQDDKTRTLLLELLCIESVDIAAESADVLSKMPPSSDTQKALEQFNKRMYDEKNKHLVVWVDNNNTIMILNINTKKAIELYKDKIGRFSYPILSPDNCYVAFAIPENKLNIIRTNGKNLRTIADFTEGDRYLSFTWSPDSTKIAVALNATYEDEDGLYLVDILTGKKEKLMGGDIYSPAFSPNGKEIAFQAAIVSHYQIYTIRIQNKSFSRISEHEDPDYDPWWEHDGKHIIFRSADGFMYITDSDGENEKKLLPTADMTGVFDSPDNKRAALIQNGKLLMGSRGDKKNDFKLMSGVKDDTEILGWSDDSTKVILITKKLTQPLPFPTPLGPNDKIKIERNIIFSVDESGNETIIYEYE